ncbi:MAG TPA: aldo/keto reductase [Microlunatus sp.]
MEYRRLGRSGIEVSEVCLGAMQFGVEAPEADSVRMLDTFAAAGGNFIDTAGVYGGGRSEEVLGRWLAGKQRGDFVIATKVYDPPTFGDNSRGSILAGVEASLGRLGTDYIDLYQVHIHDPLTPEEEVLQTLNGLVSAGKIRYFGVSNYPAYALQKSIDLARSRGWESYVSLQPQYNLLKRDVEWELLHICADEGLGVLPWGPLNAGWLSGRYRRGMDAPPDGTRIADFTSNQHDLGWQMQATEANWATLDVLFAVAERLDRTPAQVALRWLIQQPTVTAPILGPRSHEHLIDNLGAVGWTLDDACMDELTRSSARPLPYPQRVLRDSTRRARPPVEPALDDASGSRAR